ncbi:XRE family transcriptional regulator [Bacillus thuringiensis LM1212]|uniref:helix-turn-helix transcriptional regulator n=1 Tax=Bacillus cereus group TaxID=86661 RepID=UPI0003FE15C9|nr:MULTISPECIES: helix-turn-helix transcriptional regulator [Bacillus cereus group]AXY10578.1 XRE family transcriptional regulator [Bacillus thuringiensis LM1212]QDF23480.1 helix-turn-helix transcriptional regulator [Bacillus tropicus]QUG96800.1 helix-turn-helix transcriptional regulator [Bacillus tropicus]
MEFKCRLRVIFAEKNIKMGDFADSVGINRSTLSLIVNGKTLPNFTNAYIIAQNLKIPIEKIWILEEE